MEKFVIEGGVPLSGTVEPAGNKNAALPLLACALLTEQDVVLHNVPRIRDTEAMLELLADLGTRVDRRAANTVVLNAANVTKTDVEGALAERIRASWMPSGHSAPPSSTGATSPSARPVDCSPATSSWTSRR
jgi:UDP-N-acetylglucosamine 1-carboxyvinyltransferase